MSRAIGRWLREPLLHFLVVGLALFSAYRALHPERAQPDTSRKIVLTADEVRQLGMAWTAQGRAAPTREEMRSLVEDRIREEVLYREALAAGLDQGDTIVRRRLAQKMDFLTEDVAALREPTRDELRAWFAQNAARFTRPARASFRHLYFSPDRRGGHTRTDAERALARVAGRPADTQGALALADPFMFQDYYGDRSFDQLATSFGPAFARALFAVAPGTWQGPIESGYGWHLVFVDSITPSRIPDYAEVEPDVRSAWLAAQREERKRVAYDAMRARYEVVLPEDGAAELANQGSAERVSPAGITPE